MRQYFTDAQRLKLQAKEAISSGNNYIRRWWCQKYNRPANDPLFEERSHGEWIGEMYEDLYEQKQEIEAQLDPDTDTPQRERTVLMTRLRKLNKMLDEDVGQSDDPLIDKWERELEVGIEPDLDEMPEQAAE